MRGLAYQYGHSCPVDSGDHHGDPGSQEYDSTEDEGMFWVPDNVASSD